VTSGGPTILGPRC